MAGIDTSLQTDAANGEADPTQEQIDVLRRQASGLPAGASLGDPAPGAGTMLGAIPLATSPTAPAATTNPKAPVPGADALNGGDALPSTQPVGNATVAPSVPGAPSPFSTTDPMAFLPSTNSIPTGQTGQIAPTGTPGQAPPPADPTMAGNTSFMDAIGAGGSKEMQSFFGGLNGGNLPAGVTFDPATGSLKDANGGDVAFAPDGSMIVNGHQIAGANSTYAGQLNGINAAAGLPLPGNTPPPASSNAAFTPAYPGSPTAAAPTSTPAAPTGTAPTGGLNGLPASPGVPSGAPSASPALPGLPGAATTNAASASPVAAATPSTSPSAPPSLNGLPATSNAMNAVQLTPTTPQNALTNSTITPGAATDRFAIAKQRTADWTAQEQPIFDENIKRLAENGAGRGQVGSGMVRGAFRDAANTYDAQRLNAERGFQTDALTGSIDDAYKNIGIAQQQQGFQSGQQQIAFGQNVQLQQLANSTQGQQFQQMMASMGFNATQQQQAFENAYKVQQLSDDETGQSFYRALQQEILGTQGDPAQYYAWLAGQWANTGVKIA